MRIRQRNRTHRLGGLAAVAAAAAMAGCGLLSGGDEEPMVMIDPPDIGTTWTEGAVRGPARAATPSVTGVEEMTAEDEEGTAAVMRTPVAGGEYHVGIAAGCDEQGAVVTVSLGAFPADYRPVQLAVRTVDGDTERFGPVLKLGIEHGFHSPRLEDEDEIERFLAGALQRGALISNGFHSFFNEAGEAAAETIREVLAGCDD